jgi:hypothetical protein
MYFLSCPVGGLATHYEMQLAAILFRRFAAWVSFQQATPDLFSALSFAWVFGRIFC